MFNWVSIKDVNSLINFLKNPDLLLSKGISLDYNSAMYNDNALLFAYHTKMDARKLINSDDDTVKKDTEEVLSRFNYLRNKFLNTLKSDTKKLFVHRFNNNTLKNNVNDVIKNLSECMDLLVYNKESKLLIIFDKEYLSDYKLNIPHNVIIKIVDKTVNSDLMHDLCFDTWLSIYNKFIFPSYSNKYKKNIKKFKIKRKLELKFIEKIFSIKSSREIGYKNLTIFGFTIKIKSVGWANAIKEIF